MATNAEKVWTIQDVTKLINLYEDNPCLYNTLIKGYKDKALRKLVMHRIAEELQTTGLIMEFDEEYNAFLQDLQQYPNYFQMGTEKCSSNYWRKISKKLEDEKEDLLKSSDLDQIQNHNLEACVSYNLGDVDKAENIISKVLEDTNSSSINACAMMAILSLLEKERSQKLREI
ncbi:hypothetical protein LOTGIDRAFT_158336 [Lottia gigantea]|uniref:MADF domain-containing protein n=1 Tax=Lottia gigantea TaxID=225164 RepID=V4B1D2_LOTGI|nr:hypothetical protein LOTGIDRAFT_158336 [Lottia gigantea]ESP00107.1 hypothetical protein LOTGIDRAFT_158336 [Lottia gigantea]